MLQNSNTISKYVSIFGILISAIIGSNIQAQSIQNYKINYEKRVNVNKLYPRWANYSKADKFHTENFTLITDSKQSQYQRIEKDILEESDYLSSFMAFSHTYINIATQSQISQKEVGEKTFLMKDSLPVLTWHIQDEQRTIAGYNCYKAMAKYADSIVIVAYFTEQLQAPIGPESVTGLPGTILGMVIPKMHTTWLATSVTSLESQPETKFVPPSKGEAVSKSSLMELVKKVYKDYDNLYSIIYRVIL